MMARPIFSPSGSLYTSAPRKKLTRLLVRCSVIIFPPFALEESLEEASGLFLHDPGQNVDTMVQPGMIQNVEEGSAGAGLGVGRAEHHHGNPGQDDGPRAHAAGLDRRI